MIQNAREKDRQPEQRILIVFSLEVLQKARAKERQLEEKSLFDIELGIHSKSKREGEAARAENSD